jgi:hypothetical protein
LTCSVTGRLMSDAIKVGICDEHPWAGAHVFDTFEYGDGDERCRAFVEIPDFVHECSEDGNAFGGYDCTCGQPWLRWGCMTGASQ